MCLILLQSILNEWFYHELISCHNLITANSNQTGLCSITLNFLETMAPLIHTDWGLTVLLKFHLYYSEYFILNGIEFNIFKFPIITLYVYTYVYYKCRFSFIFFLFYVLCSCDSFGMSNATFAEFGISLLFICQSKQKFS